MMTFKKTNYDETVVINGPPSTPIIYEKCRVAGIIFSEPSCIDEKVEFKNIEIKNCKVGFMTISAMNFSNITINGLAISDRIDALDPLFRNCSLSGKIGSLLILDQANRGNAQDPFNQQIRDYNDIAYQNMDWALDISEADFTEFDCRSIPAEKIRINDQFQIAVNYQKLAELSNHPDDFIGDIALDLELRVKTKYNFVLTTSRRLKSYQSDLQYFDYIRSSGCENR